MGRLVLLLVVPGGGGAEAELRRRHEGEAGVHGLGSHHQPALAQSLQQAHTHRARQA